MIIKIQTYKQMNQGLTPIIIFDLIISGNLIYDIY